MASEAVASSNQSQSSQRVQRHPLIDRVYHWLLAITVLTLIYTAFWPTVFQDKTVVMSDPHWIAGAVLVILVGLHIVRVLICQNWRWMMPDRNDLKCLGRGGAHAKSGKYNLLQKLFHLGAATLILAILATGIVMLFKLGTPSDIPVQIVPKNPYILEQPTWDVIYALHGLASAALVAMVIIHVYFVLRPDEWHLTRSMFRGWISREEYKANFDASRWNVSDGG
jgi:cytochrome b subunit of formate dehydrogenase